MKKYKVGPFITVDSDTVFLKAIQVDPRDRSQKNLRLIFDANVALGRMAGYSREKLEVIKPTRHGGLIRPHSVDKTTAIFEKWFGDSRISDEEVLKLMGRIFN